MTEQQIELQMRVFNERIGETERTLEWLYEQRREFINRHNLNRVSKATCKCGERKGSYTGCDCCLAKSSQTF